MTDLENAMHTAAGCLSAPHKQVQTVQDLRMPIGRCVTAILACRSSAADYPFVGDISDEDHLGRADVLQDDIGGGRSNRRNFRMAGTKRDSGRDRGQRGLPGVRLCSGTTRPGRGGGAGRGRALHRTAWAGPRGVNSASQLVVLQ